jgi:biopolymer transport protein TolQ
MNPADVAQSALPIASSDVSLIALFLQAHWIVKSVMLGLLACSVWVWAIAIDKMFLYSRTKRAMDRFEQAFWSGQSIEELYRALSAKPTQSMAACFVAAMREWKRSFESQAKSFAGLQMRIEGHERLDIKGIERLERHAVAGDGRLGRAVNLLTHPGHQLPVIAFKDFSSRWRCGWHRRTFEPQSALCAIPAA